MLSMKAWLETRWRLLFVIAIPLVTLVIRYDGLTSNQDARRLMTPYAGSLSYWFDSSPTKY